MSDIFPTAPSAETAEAMRSSATRLANAIDERQRARDRLHEYQRSAKADSDRLAELTDKLALATAAEICGEVAAEPPSPSEIADLRTKVSLIDRVTAELSHKAAAAENLVSRREDDRRAATRGFIAEIGINPARAKVADAFEALAEALAELLTAHRLAHSEYRDPDGQQAIYSRDDLFGPAMHFLQGLRRLNWETYPYSIRPDWLPANGEFYPDEWRGAQDARRELTAKILAGGVQ